MMENQSEIHKRIQNLLCALDPKIDVAVDSNLDLFESGTLDSFGVIEFISLLENEFSIKIPQSDLIPQNLWTISAIAKLVINIKNY